MAISPAVKDLVHALAEIAAATLTREAEHLCKPSNSIKITHTAHTGSRGVSEDEPPRTASRCLCPLFNRRPAGNLDNGPGSDVPRGRCAIRLGRSS